MTNIPYSTKPIPTLGQIRDVNINVNTLTTGQVISYDAPTQQWVNSAGGGGGGATITGTDNAVVFKNGLNGDAPSDGITKAVAAGGFTINLDTTTKKVGINKINPAVNLDVGGDAQFTNATETLKIEGDLVGLVAGTETLKLYSHNLPAVADGLTEVDSSNKVITSSGLKSLDPVAFDAPNGTPDGAFYKIKLQDGFNQQPAGHPLWDEQLPFDPTGTNFPTGQIVEYHNTLPRNFPRIVARTATGVAIVPANIYVISLFGSTFAFQDRCIYDPCMMRSRKTGTGWVWAGAPTQYRNADVKAMLKVRWYFEGRWAVSNPANRNQMYVNQFRNGALLRTFLCAESNNADACFMSGERLFMGFGAYGEDIDWSQDDFQVEIANQGTSNITADLAQVEMEFILAQ